jgi:hypothetical protein
VVTSRISASPTLGASPTRFTNISVAANVSPPATGENMLAGSTVTLVMSTSPKKTKPNPVNTSGQGVVDTEQNGAADSLVMVIFVSPTSIVESSDTPGGKCAGIKDGGGGGFSGPFGPSISNGSRVRVRGRRRCDDRHSRRTEVEQCGNAISAVADQPGPRGRAYLHQHRNGHCADEPARTHLLSSGATGTNASPTDLNRLVRRSLDGVGANTQVKSLLTGT